MMRRHNRYDRSNVLSGPEGHVQRSRRWSQDRLRSRRGDPLGSLYFPGNTGPVECRRNEGGRSMAALDHASAVYVLDRAEEPVLLAIDAGGEEKRVGGAAVAAVAEAQAPQAFNLDRRAAFALQLAAKSSRRRESVDATIAEVPDQDVVVGVEGSIRQAFVNRAFSRVVDGDDGAGSAAPSQHCPVLGRKQEAAPIGRPDRDWKV